MSRIDEFLDAAEGGEVDKVRALLTDGKDIDINALNQWGNTALIEAANHGDTEIVKMLIERGAKMDEVSQGGRTALMCAVNREHAEIVDLLLKAGADPNREDLDGSTALSLAKLRGDAEIVRALTAADAR